MTTTDRPIELSSFTTGRTETSYGIRNSVAFDLRSGCSSEAMVSAVIVLPERIVEQGARVELRLPESDRPCAHVRGQNRLVLDSTALGDLKAAAGSFFYLDAVVTARTGELLPAKTRALDRFTLRIRQSKAQAYRTAA